MKNIFKLSAIAMLLMSAVSCVPTSDNELTVISPSETPKLLAPADGAVFILDKLKAADMATTLVWDYTKYDGTQTVINYEVEMAKAGTDFKAINVITKTTDRLVALTVAQLNDAALNTGLAPFSASDAEIRIKSYVGVSGVPQYSNVVKLKITPYPAWDNWGIIGSATPNGWGDPDTNLTYDLATKKYTFDGALKAGEYKFRLDDAWTVNRGDTGADFSMEQNGDNMKIAADGNYLITVDFKANIYSIVKK
ncbi:MULTISPECIES: SusE domain-containing protein [Flavobacterium]|uniref:SusE domain-containing protein n=1 Tax=Flavobacterium TaxID=237 RepID=UPI0022AC668D|nr:MULTISPECIES: SusE domain-containing protein [Flavobacterium]